MVLFHFKVMSNAVRILSPQMIYMSKRMVGKSWKRRGTYSKKTPDPIQHKQVLFPSEFFKETSHVPYGTMLKVPLHDTFYFELQSELRQHKCAISFGDFFTSQWKNCMCDFEV